MPHSYATYTSASIRAIEFNPRSQGAIDRKQEIISNISQHYGSTPGSILFVGFNPLIMGIADSQIYITAVDATTKKFLDSNNIKYTYIEFTDLSKHKKEFNWVVAGDEYFTFAKTEDDQRTSVELMVGLAKDLVVTTLKDYKNQDFKNREFSQPLAVYNNSKSLIFLEYHHYDYNDKNSWTTSVYEIEDAKSTMYGPFDRRSMFFKQLAKFSIDAGAKEFYVHKNLMYKSLIKKNYEHVITISF